jgi:EAL domain-containing protein (putative c-di-GMP-specific phosphodiesterase class I)/DNA-binding NarL/FixJ family response regulator
MEGDMGRQINRRILVIDDNPSIHDDFRKILASAFEVPAQLLASEDALFGDAREASPAAPLFQVESAYQGAEGVECVRRALAKGRPYALAFVDARMPPGIDGIETAAKIWEIDPSVQIVICTAYADYSWQEIRRKLVHADRLVILKKPFDNIEVLQLADSLTEKWRLGREDVQRLEDLERRIGERNKSISDSGNGARGLTEEQLQRRRDLAFALERALRNRELTLHYQPLVDIASRRIVSLEALMRWTHPQLGPVSPAEFIPIAEECGLIAELGDYALLTACEQTVRWERANVPVVPVSVNVSVVQLETKDVLASVRDALHRTGMKPQRLALELTESAFMTDALRHVEALQALRRDGVRIQIDDFGTGYSSLSSLKSLPIDTVKIDRSFIKHLDSSPTDEAIVAAIFAMARSLGLRVIAEGVETQGQLEVLGRHGCDTAQGFYFSRPLPAAECAELLVDLATQASVTDTLRMRSPFRHGVPHLEVIEGRQKTG